MPFEIPNFTYIYQNRIKGPINHEVWISYAADK